MAKLFAENKNLKRENDILQREKSRKKSVCNVQEHGRFDELRKQNIVLQEIVKAMRKERTVAGLGDAQIDAGRRVERLEKLVQLLKRSLFGPGLQG